MLELDFSPKPQKAEKRHREIHFYILFTLFIGMSLLYFRESRKARNLMNTQAEILKNIHEQLEGRTNLVQGLSPYYFRFRGVVGNDKNVYILLEDKKNKTYLVEDGSILLGWEIKYMGGDSLIFRSIETGEKILLKMGRGP